MQVARCGIFGRFSNLDKCRPEAASDVNSPKFVGPIGLDKCVVLYSFNRSREMPPKAVLGGIFDSFFAITSHWK